MPRTDVTTILQWYDSAKQTRSSKERQWRLNAAYCDPRQYDLWQRQEDPSAKDDRNTSNDSIARFVYDNTGMRCMPKYEAILHRMLTPEGQRYHGLQASEKSLMKRYAVRTYFWDLTNLLFKMRYEPRANFHQAQGEMYCALGTYGTAPKVLKWRTPAPDDPRGGFIYKSWPLVDIFLVVDNDGRVCAVIRRMFLNVREFRTEFPGENEPPSLVNEAKNPTPSENTRAEFIHCVHRRMEGYDNKALDSRRFPWASNYVCVNDKMYIGEEQGFLTNPYMTPRTKTSAGDPYGYSPAEMAFPTLGGLSAVKKTVLKSGHLAVSPPWAASDDGAISGRLDVRPNKVNYGAVDKQGNLLVKPMISGANFQVAEKLIEGDRLDVEDSFLVTLFRILEKAERMTTAEVYERVSLQAGQIAPTMGRLQSEDQGPQIERELALLAEKGKLPPPPPELIEAKGEYTVNYTSPLAKSMQAESISGWTRTLELAFTYTQQTGDKRPLYHFNFDTAIPEMADILNAPPHWMNDEKIVKALMQKDEEAAQAEQMVKAAPAAASVMTAAMKQRQQGAGG